MSISGCKGLYSHAALLANCCYILWLVSPFLAVLSCWYGLLHKSFSRQKDKGLFLLLQIQFMRRLNVVLATVLFCLFSVSAIGQQKASAPKKATPTKKAAQTPAKEDLPPEVERLEDTKITPTQPEINFDTTAAVDDAFTKDILALLTLTGALENDVKAAEQSLKQSFGDSNDPNTTAFYQRFMHEMREGRARRWMTNLYVRTYRENFTHS